MFYALGNAHCSFYCNSVVPGGTHILERSLEQESSIDQSLRTGLEVGLPELPNWAPPDRVTGGVNVDAIGADFDISHLKDFEAEGDGVDATGGETGDEVALEGGGGLSREISLGIGAPAMVSWQGAVISGGEPLTRTASFDINTLFQVSLFASLVSLPETVIFYA